MFFYLLMLDEGYSSQPVCFCLEGDLSCQEPHCPLNTFHHRQQPNTCDNYSKNVADVFGPLGQGGAEVQPVKVSDPLALHQH